MNKNCLYVYNIVYELLVCGWNVSLWNEYLFRGIFCDMDRLIWVERGVVLVKKLRYLRVKVKVIVWFILMMIVFFFLFVFVFWVNLIFFVF